jgi:hypothetical protein
MNTLNNYKGEIVMKLYLGIRQTDSHLYITALNNQGQVVLKTSLPSTCSPQALICSFKAIQQAFSASIRIATCLPYDHHQLLLEVIQREFPSVRPFSSSIFHSIPDLISDQDPYALNDLYRHSLLLAILDSLDQ